MKKKNTFLKKTNLKFGSVRFCSKYLKIPDVEARKQFIKSRRLCNNCLRKNHNAASCRMKILNCFYCKEALKTNSGHNSSLCENFTDEEFRIIKNQFEEKDRERKTRENRTEDTYNISADEDEASYSQYDGDEECDSYQHSYFLEMTLEQEIEKSKADGLMEDDVELKSFDITEGKRGIRSIGIALVGEDKNKVNLLSDIGSTGCFVTHSLAKRSGLRKKKITTLQIKSITEFKCFKTFFVWA